MINGDPMEYLEWSDAMTVGIEAIDRDHRHLFWLLGCLRDDISSQRETNAIARLKQLAEYTRFHFDKEETFLRAMGYPNLAAHQAMHDAMVRDLSEALADQTGQPDPDLLQKLYDFALSWLKSHILLEDIDYARYYTNNG